MSTKSENPKTAIAPSPVAKKNGPVLIGKVFNGSIQSIGGIYENEKAAKEALKNRKADGVFVLLPVLEL